MSKEYDRDEIVDEFLTHIKNMCYYWDRTENDSFNKLTGLAFSVLVAIDGCSNGLPAYLLAPLPHPTDKQYAIDEDRDYYPQNHKANVKCEMGGGLHDKFGDYFDSFDSLVDIRRSWERFNKSFNEKDLLDQRIKMFESTIKRLESGTEQDKDFSEFVCGKITKKELWKRNDNRAINNINKTINEIPMMVITGEDNE